MCLPAYKPCLCCFETIALGFVPNKIPRDCVILLMGLWALWAYSCCFGTFALGFVPNKIPRNCVILLMGLWALWAYFYCFGTFALGFVPNKISRNCVILLIDLWALWVYFYLTFAFRLLRQVPLHLGLLSCCGLGLNYCILIIVSFAGMSINKYQTL